MRLNKKYPEVYSNVVRMNAQQHHSLDDDDDDDDSGGNELAFSMVESPMLAMTADLSRCS